MNTILFYFLGTGNSLHISRRISAKLGGISTRSIVSLLSSSPTQIINAKTVGFVFPTYFYALPEIVKTAIRQCDFNEGTYFYAVATNGGEAGNALFDLDAILRSKNSRLHYGISIPLGDNSIAIRTPSSKAAQLLSASNVLLDRFVQSVLTKEVGTVWRRNTIATLKGSVIRFSLRHYYRFEDRRIDSTACTNCGLCQRICPVNNIHVEQDEVRIGKNCAECFACINYCPHQAIRFGRLHPRKETQYRFPGVTAADIIASKAKRANDKSE